jgi:hypothetical protein
LIEEKKSRSSQAGPRNSSSAAAINASRLPARSRTNRKTATASAITTAAIASRNGT